MAPFIVSATNIIITTPVRSLRFVCKFSVLFLVSNLIFGYGCRVMARPSSQQPQFTHVLEMAIPRLCVLVYLLKLVFFYQMRIFKVLPLSYALQDLEFIHQFHPTGVNGVGSLITQGCIYSNIYSCCYLREAYCTT